MTYDEKKELRAFYRNLLDSLCEDWHFKCLIDNPTSENYDDLFYREDDDFDVDAYLRQKHICFLRGETKLVFYESTRPYVIKIPLYKNSGSYSNYCEIELSNYNKACDAELEECFAWINHLMDYGAVEIYIMEKVDVDEEEISDRSYELARREVIRDLGENEDELEEWSCHYWDCDDEDKIEDFLIDKWGIDTYLKFEDFCEENEINDRHFGNWGLREDYPVIIDYSGY